MICLPFLLSASSAEVKIYRGTSQYNSDIICTVRDGKVYDGTSNYSFDIRFTIDGGITLEEFVAVWHAVNYVW